LLLEIGEKCAFIDGRLFPGLAFHPHYRAINGKKNVVALKKGGGHNAFQLKWLKVFAKAFT
jgi:hypothetical protein